MNFDIPSLNVQPFLLVDQKLIHILPLITLKLNHLPHLGIIDNIAIARKLLLQRLEDFLRTKLLGQTLDSSQSLTVGALLNPNVDEVGARLFASSPVFSSASANGSVVLRFSRNMACLGLG